MAGSQTVKGFVLSGVCAVYVLAFASFLYQSRGLFGPNGISPIDWERHGLLFEIGKQLNLAQSDVLEIISLSGLVLAMMALTFQRLRTSITMLVLLLLYYVCQKTGAFFMNYQWDLMLLEAGFLSALLAPLIRSKKSNKEHSLEHKDALVMFMFRWLMFRLMFSSGAVKLLSRCPLWWSLRATFIHYQSQCIPSPASWFAHHMLPNWAHQLSDALTFIVMMGFSFPALLPIGHLRIVSFIINLILQLAIALTGNFNFMNFLTVIISLSLLHRRTSESCGSCNGCQESLSRRPLMMRIMLTTWSFFLYLIMPVGITMILLKKYFGMIFDKTRRTIDFDIAFTHEHLLALVDWLVMASCALAATNMVLEIMSMFRRSIKHASGKLSVLVAFYGSLFYSLITATLFLLSVVRFGNLSPTLFNNMPKQLTSLDETLAPFGICNEYGLFAIMTGEDGRRELIVEGSMDDTTWMEYDFIYKPGRLNQAPKQAAPYQPRLDWQMWFAALSNSEREGWYLYFVYRLLTGSDSVRHLIKNDPFNGKLPKTIRTTLYIYNFAPFSTNTDHWWERDIGAIWHLPVSLENEAFNLCKQLDSQMNISRTAIGDLLAVGRSSMHSITGPQFCMSSLLVCLLTMQAMRFLFGQTTSTTSPSCQKKKQSAPHRLSVGTVGGQRKPIERTEGKRKRKGVSNKEQ